MYKVWKASVDEYRVLNTLTGRVEVLKNFTILGCSFKVDINLYNSALERNFANSGDDNDYFAWIECKRIIRNNKNKLVSKVFYNPFKSSFFRDRTSLEIKSFADKVEINGNTLSYE